jgi:phosphoglycolate phosphatase
MTDWQGLIFDKDGTLFEFSATWEAWAQAFLLRITNGDRGEAARIGLDIGFDFATRRFSRDSVVIAGTPEEIAQAMAPHFPDLGHDAILKMLNEEATMAPQVEAVPLVPFLTDLRAQGLKLGVATNDSEDPALAHLHSAGVVQLFDFIAGFDSGYGGKPAAGQLNAFCTQTGCDPSRVAMVGDSTHDLKAGAAAGMRCIGVLTGMAPREVLAPYADVVLPDIGHIPEWLKTA